MSFQTPSKEDLLALINTANAINPKILLTDVSWSTPQVVSGTWRDQQTTKNTAVRLTATENGALQGSVVQLYDRLDIASLAKIPGFRLVAPSPQKTHDLLRNIKFFTGVNFTTDDLENLDITTVDNKRMAVLSAKPGSIGWFGNLSMEVKEGGVLLNDAVTQTVLPGLLYPNTEATPGTDVMGSVYLYGYDFTKYVNDLISIAPGALALADGNKIVTMLKAMDVSSGKTLWNTDASSTAWSLEGATVVRNGLNSNTLPTNPAYKYVLGLQLKASVTTPKGIMYLHYNDPFNPEEF